MHGRDHYPGGADPIRAIYYDYLNGEGEGPSHINLPGFLDVTTDSYTLFLNSGAGGILLQDVGTGGVSLLSSSFIGIENSGNGGTSISDLGSGGLHLFSSNSADMIGSTGASLVATTGQLNIFSTDSPIVAYASGGATNSAMIQMRIDSTRYFIVCDNVLPTTFFAVRATGTFMFNLPTSNPGVTGQLWNSAGTVKIV